ncbi:MAG: lipid A export permease/ATP-binding protein MsbA [Burkholderiales bacterium]|jgi:subfamily B ATP-binding cassette protein MsbA|nr:lipid A export permease/ATP-binding protein MsbA [Nitrosomonadaceae bacterium]
MTTDAFSTERTPSGVLYKRLLGYVKPYRWPFAGAILAMAIGGIVEGSFAWYFKYMLETLFVEDNERYAALAGFGVVLVFFFSGLSHFIAGYGMQWVGNKLMLDIRNQMFAKLIRLPVPMFDRVTSGTLMSKVTNDVIGVQAAATTALTSLVRGTFTLITLLVTMFVLNWRLTLITFVTVPLLGWIIRSFGKRLRRINEQGQVAHAAITDVLEEAIRGQKVVKVFGGEAYEASRFDHAANTIRRLNMKQSAAAAAATPLTHLIVSMAIGFIIYLAASRTLGTGMEIAEFVTFIMAAAGLVPQIKQLASVNEQIQKGLAASQSVFSLIDAVPENDSGTKRIERATGRLQFDGVSVQYASKSTPALDSVSLEIRPGETIALVGPSGGGKTSLVNLVPRFFEPSAGRVLLDGMNITDIRLAHLRAQMALVSQDVVLFNDTVAANIAYGAKDANRDAIEAAARAAHCLDFIGALPEQFDTVIGENGARLSGGQRQRLAIARALYKNAPILLLDEATSALDSESERAVQEALDVLMQGRTTIVVAHRLSTIENASRIAVMEAGKIVELGPHSELIRRGGLYASLHRLQFATA